MARYVLPVIGAAVGYMIGGPTGAMWGWQLGSAAGGLVDPQVIKGPGIGDIAQQTSQEGVPRPIVFGISQPFAGNIIASGPPRIVTERSSGKGGPRVESESVYRTYAIRICEGPIASVSRVWRNNKLVYDGRENSSLTPAENQKFLNNARFFLGSFDQMPSPDLEAIFGIGTTPAHRGTALMVMADELLNDTGGAIPQYMFQVNQAVRLQTRIVYEANGTFEKPETDLLDYIEVWGWAGGGGGASGGIRQPVISGGAGGGGGGGGGYGKITINAGDLDSTVAVTVGLGGVGGAAVAGAAINTGNAGTDGGDSAFGSYMTIGGGRAGGTSGRTDGTWSDGGAGYPILASPTRRGGNGGEGGQFSSPNGASAQFGAPGGAVGGCDFEGLTSRNPGTGGSSPTGFSPILAGGSGGTNAAPPSSDALAGSNGASGAPYLIAGSGGGGGGGAWSRSAGSGTPTFAVSGKDGGSAGISSANPGDAGKYGAGGGGGGAGYVGAVTPSATVSGKGGNGAQGVIVVDLFYSAAPPSVTLQECAASICERAGLDESMFDVTALPDVPLLGLTIINTYPSYTALQALGQMYFFAPAYYDGVVHFVPAGGNVVATITEDDMVDDHDIDIELSQRDDSIAVPRVMHLNYFDVDGGLATDKQSSERAGDRRAQGEQSLSSSVLMDATRAARAVAVNHKVAIEELRGSIKFSLPDSWLGLVPTNPIIVQSQGRSRRCRITKLDLLDGYQEYEAYYDRQSAYTSEVEGIPPAPQTPPPSGIVGPTLIEPLDIHILRDADDNAGLSYYVAISGSLAAWNGALVELSIDGGLNYIDSMSSSVSSIIGILEAVLPDHPQEFPDEEHTLSVNIQTPNGDLLSTDFAGLLNGVNLAIVGNELIQFGAADETTEGHWELTSLLRGRKGTQTQQHEIGERFVLLNRSSLGIVPASVADIARTFTFRATSFGDTVDNATITTMTYTGMSQTEREVGYLQARRDGTDAIVSWQGIGRLGGGAQVAQGARFTGYRVRFEGADSGDTTIQVDTVNQAITQDISSLTDPVRVVVVQLNSLTGEGPETEVYI